MFQLATVASFLFLLTDAHALVGDYLSETSFPDQVCSILIPNMYKPGGKPIQCTGTIVGNRQLVTAGHCTSKFEKEPVEIHCPGGIKRTVKSHVTHETYEKHSGFEGFDIGLIEVNEDFGVPPVPVANTQNEIRKLLGKPAGQHCSYFGYGVNATGETGVSKGVKAGKVEITEGKMLFQKAGPLRSGDSGGPLLCKNEADQWVLTGTMIRGFDKSPDGKGPIDSYTESLEVTGKWLRERLRISSIPTEQREKTLSGQLAERCRMLQACLSTIEATAGKLGRDVTKILAAYQRNIENLNIRETSNTIEGLEELNRELRLLHAFCQNATNRLHDSE